MSILREERIGGQRLILGDCVAVLGSIGPIDAVITDPPYSSGGFQESGKASGSIGTRSGEMIAGDTLSTRGYLRLMKSVFRAARADEFFVFTDWRMWINTFDAMEDGYIRVRNMLVWDKQQMGMGLPWRNQHELIAYGKRSSAKNVTGRNGNVLSFSRSGNNHHPTEKPVGLIEELLRNSLAKTVVDPFMGSGTTLVACQRLGRMGTGVEIDPEYWTVACERVHKAWQQADLFVATPEQPKQGELL